MSSPGIDTWKVNEWVTTVQVSPRLNRPTTPPRTNIVGGTMGSMSDTRRPGGQHGPSNLGVGEPLQGNHGTYRKENCLEFPVLVDQVGFTVKT